MNLLLNKQYTKLNNEPHGSPNGGSVEKPLSLLPILNRVFSETLLFFIKTKRPAQLASLFMN